MIFRACAAVVVLLAAAATSNAAEGKMRVFILAGQSNMVGVADVKDLSAEMQKSPANVRITTGGKWTALSAGPAGTRFGPEVGFGHAVAKALPKENIGLVKFAVGGNSLCYS